MSSTAYNAVIKAMTLRYFETKEIIRKKTLLDNIGFLIQNRDRVLKNEEEEALAAVAAHHDNELREIVTTPEQKAKDLAKITFGKMPSYIKRNILKKVVIKKNQHVVKCWRKSPKYNEGVDVCWERTKLAMDDCLETARYTFNGDEDKVMKFINKLSGIKY